MRIRISRRRVADMSTRSRRLPLYLGVIMVGAVLTTACSAQDGGGEAEGSCAIAAMYGGRTYTQVANVDFTVGKALGPAEFPPCDDTPGHTDDAAGPEPTTAYAVDGLNPRIAIAMRYTSDEVMLLAVQPGGSLPPEVKALARGQR
ncbi:hypothetical protein GTY65_23885 [Streptomyces sp. SID8379]|uniref:DUF6281 family protein n=1 Tax=unclassified Streptomyces TaxID=2593676 RepID=UPI0004772DC8|nr:MULTISPECIES: DUF6281 family protein [unclassified Streptomyces]MYW67089.1 hypothetical protein [Streptomyces sp. SID8379]